MCQTQQALSSRGSTFLLFEPSGLTQAGSEGLIPRRTHIGEVIEKLLPIGKTRTGKVHGRLCPVGGTPHTHRARVRTKEQQRHVN